jgi:hypothetical protein
VAELTVIRWRDIPMQVLARDEGGESARALLPERFQEAVDAAAMVAGLIGSDDYTEQMRMDTRECGADLRHEVDTETVKILSEWDEDMLKAAIRTGGVLGGPDVSGANKAVRPSGDGEREG